MGKPKSQNLDISQQPYGRGRSNSPSRYVGRAGIAKTLPAEILTSTLSQSIAVVWESRRRRVLMRHRNPLVAGAATVRLGKLVSCWHEMICLSIFLQEPHHNPSKWLGKAEVAEF